MLDAAILALALATGPTPGCSAWLGDAAPITVGIGPTIEQRARLLAGGGTVKAVDGSYYAVDLPAAFWQARQQHVLVALHGSHGAPEAEWNDWHGELARRGWGYLGLAWFDSRTGRYDDDTTIYRRLTLALDTLRASCGLTGASFHLLGFSAGGAMTYPVGYLDLHGRRFFHGIAANAGAWPIDGPLYPTLAAVERRGEGDALLGLSFWMYCGELDSDPGWEMCPAMEEVRIFLLQHGAQASLLRNPTGDHRSLPTTSAAVEAMFRFFESVP